MQTRVLTASDTGDLIVSGEYFKGVLYNFILSYLRYFIYILCRVYLQYLLNDSTETARKSRFLVFNPKPPLESSRRLQSKNSRNFHARELPMAQIRELFVSRTFHVLQ